MPWQPITSLLGLGQECDACFGTAACSRSQDSSSWGTAHTQFITFLLPGPRGFLVSSISLAPNLSLSQALMECGKAFHWVTSVFPFSIASLCYRPQPVTIGTRILPLFHAAMLYHHSLVKCLQRAHLQNSLSARMCPQNILRAL